MFTEDECVRIYDESGNHKLSLLHCSENCIDLATPDGKVLYCDVNWELVELFAENMFVGKIVSKKRVLS